MIWENLWWLNMWNYEIRVRMNKVQNALLGLAVGDALGVPVEFLSREYLKVNPLKEMIGYGTHNQPSGTWSDDSSLAFCLAEMLCGKYDMKVLATHFVNWYEHNHWTPHGEVFDIGITTANAIRQLENGKSPVLAGMNDESSNGNGSLMRILPLLFYIKNKPISERFELINEVSCITHGHIRSVISCFIYLEFALNLLKGLEKFEALNQMQITINQFFTEFDFRLKNELQLFHRLLESPDKNADTKPIFKCDESEIQSSGYVLHTLEASFWSFLTTNTYSEAVLKAVNLGSDTDTTGAVTGGLAGLYYGIENIPEKWLNQIARKDDIVQLSNRLHSKYF